MDFQSSSNEFVGRELPYNLDAEQTVLGAILIKPNEVLPVVISKIDKPECFYNEKHKQLFSILIRMFSNNEDIDVVTVGNEAYAMGVFDSNAMTRTYLKGLIESVPSTSNIESYCNIILDKYNSRSLITVANEIIDKASNMSDSSSNLLDFAEQRIFEIRQGRASNDLKKIDEIIIETYSRLEKISGENKDEYLGNKTGFSYLDNITTGLNKSDLIIVAARPGMGKSAFALNVAVNMAKSSKNSVAVFSLEMGKEQLATRMLSSESLVNNTILRTGELETEDWNKLAEGAKSLSELPIYIDDTADITVPQMKAKLRRMRNLGLVVIDYLQLMSSTSRNPNPVAVVSELTRQLKLMAKELDVPIICLSQLSRGPEKRDDHRPLLSDLRESGSIEQDADLVMFLFRPGYYDKESESQNESECIVAKNRHGETGTVKLNWIGEYTLFRSYDFNREEN